MPDRRSFLKCLSLAPLSQLFLVREPEPFEEPHFIQAGDDLALSARIIDLDTGQEIKGCVWADERTGWMERYREERPFTAAVYRERRRIRIDVDAGGGKWVPYAKASHAKHRSSSA